MYIVYIIRFVDGSLYIGQTNNLEQRIKEHFCGATRSSKFAKEHGKFELVYRENYTSRLDSMRREKQLKGWTRAKKEALISGDIKLLKEL
jgi:predicted GIY-YIG superfamily endonuclease